MKVLLTGSSGFIGSALQTEWKNRYELFAPSHRELDLLDPASVEDYLRNGAFDVIVHTANTNDVVHRQRADHQLEFNLRMFCNLERCSNLYGKMYYFGSGAEYDMRHYIPKMKESYFGTHIPDDPYGFSKYLMSKLAGQSDNIYDFRLFGVYGPGEEWRRRFISNMIYQALNGSEMRMDRNMMFDYLYIDDLIIIMEWFLNQEPLYHHYNICSGRTVSLRDLADIIKEETGVNAEIRMNSEDWKSEYSGDNSRMIAETGGIALTPMRLSIREMMNYYKTNGFR